MSRRAVLLKQQSARALDTSCRLLPEVSCFLGWLREFLFLSHSQVMLGTALWEPLLWDWVNAWMCVHCVGRNVGSASYSITPAGQRQVVLWWLVPSVSSNWRSWSLELLQFLSFHLQLWGIGGWFSSIVTVLFPNWAFVLPPPSISGFSRCLSVTDFFYLFNLFLKLI